MKRIKRGLAVLLAAAMTVTALPQTAFAQEEAKQQATPAESEGAVTPTEPETTPLEPKDLRQEPGEIGEEPEESAKEPGDSAQEAEASAGAWQAPTPREVVDEFIQMTENQELHQKTEGTQEYRFSPEKSGWYLLTAKGAADCTIYLQGTKTIYFTSSGTDQIENTILQPYQATGEEINRVLWLSQDEIYVFSCNIMEYADSENIDIALKIKQTDLTDLQLVMEQEPTSSSSDFLNLQGAKVRVSFADESFVEEIRCEGNGAVNTSYKIDAFAWNWMAKDRTGQPMQFSSRLELKAIDGISLEQETEAVIFDGLANGAHQAKLELKRDPNPDGSQLESSDQYTFIMPFQVQKLEVDSIEVIQKKTDYIQGMGQRLSPIRLRVTYRGGREPEEISSSDGRGIQQTLKSPGGTATNSIDEWLANGGKIGAAAVTVSYKGAETAYQIQIAGNPYDHVEIRPKRTTYYAGFSSADPYMAGDWMDASDFPAILHYKDGSIEQFDSLKSLPGGSKIHFGLQLGEKLYDDIDEFIEAGGELGRQKVVFNGYLDNVPIQCEEEIEVVQNPYKSIEVVQQPNKTKYLHNASGYVELSGLIVRAYKDEAKTQYDDYAFDQPQEAAIPNWQYFFEARLGGHEAIQYLEVGEHTVSLSLMGNSTEFKIYVEETLANGLKILNPPRLEYYAGEQGADFSGLALEITGLDESVKKYQYQRLADEAGAGYSDWSEIERDLKIDSSGVDWNKTGNYQVSVSYLGQTDSYDISIRECPVEKIEIVNAPEKTAYFQSLGYQIDLRGMCCRITFKDQEHTVVEETITGEYAVSLAEVSYQDATFVLHSSWKKWNSLRQPTIGENGIKLSILDQSAIQPVTVLEDAVESLELIQNPQRTNYRFEERIPDLYGAKVRIRYRNGDTKEVEFTEHTDRMTVDDEYQQYGERLLGTLLPSDKQTSLSMTYLNYPLFSLLQLPYDIVSLPAQELEAESAVDVTLNPAQTYQVFSFTPAETKKYTFFSLGTSAPCRAELYQGNRHIGSCVPGENGGFALERELTAGVPYTYIVSMEDETYFTDVKEPVTLSCCVSAQTGDASKLEIADFSVTAPKTVWYRSESSIYLNENQLDLKGTQVHVVYKNGWKETIEISGHCTQAMIQGIPLTARWKYTTATGYGGAFVDCDRENALVYSLNGQSREVSVQLNVYSPIEIIEVLKAPEQMSQYLFESKDDPDLYGLKARITFQDGSVNEVEVTTHSGRIVVDNAYQEVLDGFVRQRASGDGKYDLYIRYMGSQRKVGEYVQKPFAEFPNLQQIQAGARKTAHFGQQTMAQVFAFTPDESARYVLQMSTADSQKLRGAVYGAAGAELAYEREDGADGKVKVAYPMTAGKTYYFVLQMDASDDTDIPCTLNLGEEVAKESIAQAVLSLDAPRAGEPFPSFARLNSDVWQIADTTWLGSEYGDGRAKYGEAHRVKLTLTAGNHYRFTSETQVTVNGKKVVSKSVDDAGRMTVYYTFPHTDCRVTFVQTAEGKLEQEMNETVGVASYGGTYQFRFVKKAGAADPILKANDKVLTADKNGLCTLAEVKENLTIYIKNGQKDAGNQESRLTLHNQSEAVYDVLTGRLHHTLAENPSGETTMPAQESYANGSDQFFFGWYLGKDAQTLNGTGTRFTSKSVLQEPDYQLYAKWASGIFTSILNNKEIHYKILSMDEDNRTKVQIGDGKSRKVRAARNLMRTRALMPKSGEKLVIPQTLPVNSLKLEDPEIHLTECAIVAVGEHAFADDSTIRSIVLPDTIETIGENAFRGSSLTEITIPQGVSTIGAGAFSGCENLTQVKIPATVTEIPEGAFRGCSSLSSVTIAEGVTEIGASAFDGCSSLTQVTLPDTIETIEADAFGTDGSNLTIYCSSQTAQSETVKKLQETTQASVQTVEIELDYQQDEKYFTYGDAAQTFTACVKIDGKAQPERAIAWSCDQSAVGSPAYQAVVSEDGGSYFVEPLRALKDDESVTITAADPVSGKARTITLRTRALDLSSRDADQEARFCLQLTGADALVYNGEAICPQVAVIRAADHTALPADCYQVSYEQNVDAGDARVTVSGSGNYSGSLWASFDIAKKAQTITAADQTRTIGDADFILEASADGKGALSYDSDQPSVVCVDPDSGFVSIEGVGSARITIQAAATRNYEAAQKTVIITIKPQGDDSDDNKPDDSDNETPGDNEPDDSDNGTPGDNEPNDSDNEKPGSNQPQNPDAGSAKKSQTITASSVTKKMGDAAFSLKAKTNGNGTLSYSSKNTKVAKVDKKGKVTLAGVGTAEIVIKASETSTYKAASRTIKITVKKGSSGLKVKKSSYTKAKGSKAFSLGASAKTTIKYKSSNTKVAKVSKKGKVTIVGCGKATITVSAAGTANYTKASKKVTIKVVPKAAKLKSVKSKKAGQLTVTWNRQKEADGYVVQYSADKKFKKKVQTKYVKKNKTTSLTLKKLTKGRKYYVRIKAYKTIGKKKAYGTASKVAAKNVKK